MGQKIYYHEYSLRSRKALNALSDRRQHRGLLIRIGDGVGCVHPWPELGDAPVEAQLEALRRAEPTALIARAVHCAGLDGLARREGKSLFDGLEIPKSHALVSGIDGVREAAEAGFAAVKLKCGDDPVAEAARVRECGEEFGSTGLRLRLDFNETLEEEGFRRFCEGAGLDSGIVEFVEDPVAYDGGAWERLREDTGVALAVDRAVDHAGRGFDCAVVKPAVHDVKALCARTALIEKPLVFTSYMDHPVGQMYAAYEAAVARRELGARVVVAGLLTHGLFEGDPFVEGTRNEGPRLVAPEGTGLGFDGLLEKIPWKRLS